jgi:6-phosphofructo-2-kinase/fructose-2,6-biphosphatase 4
MEPIILELEREENDLLIIAHESVLRVLYGYLMACNAADIPKLQFPRDEIIEVGKSVSRLGRCVLTVDQIIPSSYNNVAKRIKIPGLPQSMVPGSPEDIQIPVPPSGAVSPMPGMGTPQTGSGTATPQNSSQPLNLSKTHINPSA